MDFGAGGTLSPSVSDLSGPRGPYVADGPVGHPGTSSSSTFMPKLLVAPGGTLPPSDLPGMMPPAIPVGRWGTLPPFVSDPAGPVGQSVIGGPVGNEMKLWCFRPLLCTLLRLNWAKQTPGIMRRN